MVIEHKHEWLVTYSNESRLMAFCTNTEPQDTFEVQITVDSDAAETHKTFFDWLMNEAEKEKDRCEDCLLHNEIIDALGKKDEPMWLLSRLKGSKWGVVFKDGKAYTPHDIEDVLNGKAS